MEQSKDHIPAIIPANPALRDVIFRDVSAAQQRFEQHVRENPAGVQEATARLLFEMFVIHAEQHIQILSNPAQVRSLYAPYLLDLVEKIVGYGTTITVHWVAPFDRNRLLGEVRSSMMARVPFWISEAYTFTGGVAPGSLPGEPVIPPHTRAKLKKNRTALVHKYRKGKGLAMADLGHHVGVSTTAIYGMINGDRTRYNDAALEEFLKKLGVSREDWDAI